MKQQKRPHVPDQHAAASSQGSAATLAAHNQPHYIPAPQEVALRAYFRFLKQGSEHGHDVKHWLEAETQLLMERTFARKVDHAGTPDLTSVASHATEAIEHQTHGSNRHEQG